MLLGSGSNPLNMKKILVPTDFSPNAEKAMNYAIQVAARAGAEILLVHAIEIGGSEAEMLVEKEKLETAGRLIGETEKIPVSTLLAEDTPVNGILSAIKDFQPDLVVMGTAGSSGVKEKLYGSRTAGVIGKSPVPVLAIPLLSEWAPPQTLLLSIKEFDISVELLAPFLSLANLFKAEIQLTIFTDTDDDYVEDYRIHEGKIAILRDILKEKYPGLKIHAVHLAGKHFRDSLQNWITSHNVSIVAMLTHHKSFLASIFSPSMTKKMSYYINVPLLAIPLPAQA